MNILITGGKGRLGLRLVAELESRNCQVDAPGRAEVNWASAIESTAAIEGKRYGLIVGCAAYTDVAQAENERGKCHQDTYSTALNTAKAAQRARVPLVYISTDYVVPLLRGEPGGVYARAKLLAENAVRRHAGKIIRVAFTTLEQAEKWTWVNAYSLSNRSWCSEAASAIADAVVDSQYLYSDEPGDIIREIGPEQAVTPLELLRERFPMHPALSRKVETPEEMAALVGYSAPRDSRFHVAH